MRIVAIALTICLTVAASAQPHLGTWKSYTSMRSVRGVVEQSGTIWAASGGGLYSVDTATGAVRSYNNSSGLTSNDLLALLASPDGRIWTGASDGSVNVLDPATGSIQTIGDISSAVATSKAVRRLVALGDTVFIAWDYGVSVFRTQRWEFGDTYAYFGFPTQPKNTSVVVQGGRIWIGTTSGVATALLSDPNLVSPTAWTRYTSVGGPAASGVSLAVFHDTLIVGTSSGASYFDGSAFVALPVFSGMWVRDAVAAGGNLAVVSTAGSDSRVDILNSVTAAPAQTFAAPGIGGTSITSDGSAFSIGTTEIGVAKRNGSAWTSTVPNGPNSNRIISLGVDDGGVLWAASGTGGNGRGFYRLRPDLPEGQQWKSFTVSGYPVLRLDDYYKVSAGRGGTMWISSWGEGVVEVAGDTIRRKIDATTRPSLSGAVAQNPLYVVAGNVAYDPNGTPWVDVRTAVDGRQIAKMVNDSTFTYYQNQYNPFEGLFQSMVIDRLGTKWLGNSEPADKKDHGLYYFNETGIVAGTEATGGWGFLSTTDGLKSNSILSLAVDRDGEIWIGMDLGVAIVTNPYDPRSGRSLAYPLQQQSIQSIAVDGVNNKWVGTKEGVWVISPDGTQLLAQYTVTSTGGQLVDNDVRAIAIDQKRGIVYMGTESGLSSLQIAAVEPQEVLGTLTLSPNPFQVPASQPLMIRGLAESCSIKVLTSSGRLVAQFPSQGGGRAFWDGRDSRGNTVASGVYFVVAYTQDGTDVTSGKIAVVRR